MHLDGIRGVAAVSVTLLHFARSFDNSLLSGNSVVNRSFISVLWNGHFAVALFFVLSGHLFFKKFYFAPLQDSIIASIKRYLRLSVPILSICILAYIAHRSGLLFNAQAGTISKSDFLLKWYAFEPSAYLSITEAIWTDFVSFDPNLTYNPTLWTISFELFAVILVMFIASICKFINTYAQIAILLAAAAALYGTHYFEFILGAMLAFTSIKFNINLPLLAALFIAVFSLSLAPISLPGEIASLAPDLLYPLAATLFIASINQNKTLRRIFSNKFLLKLGDNSFGIYLTHFLIISSIASAVYIHTNSIVITFVAYALSTAIFSIIFTNLIDKPWMRTLNNLTRSQIEKKALHSRAS